MKDIKIAVGIEVPSWTYHECDGCGCTYPVSRTSVKIIAESDLMCVDCWGEYALSVKSDENKELRDQLAAAKAEIAEYRAMIESIVLDAKGYETRSNSLPSWAKDADALLAKHKGE